MSIHRTGLCEHLLTNPAIGTSRRLTMWSFVHSMVASTKYQWQSSYEQTIGRVCRRGQDQKVHIWHFVTANTVDVNILEDRTGRRLGLDGGKYSLMTVQEIAEKGLGEADCALRGVDFVGKAAGAGLSEVE